MKHTIKQGNVVMVYEGTPEEIATFNYYEENGIDIDAKYLDKKELVHDQDEVVEFIKEALVGKVTMLDEQEDIIVAILNAEEDYMRSKGIIED